MKVRASQDFSCHSAFSLRLTERIKICLTRTRWWWRRRRRRREMIDGDDDDVGGDGRGEEEYIGRGAW